MKTLFVIIDGLGDVPVPELDMRTPLEAAVVPTMHRMASRGQVGRVATAFEGFPIESMVCTMGLLGYAPERFYPSGRASFEALARDITLHDGDLALRCNIITIDPTDDSIVDFTAGLISDNEALRVLSMVDTGDTQWELHAGQSYRNLLIVRNAGIDPSSLRCAPPHQHRGEQYQTLLPSGSDTAAKNLGRRLSSFLQSSRKQLANTAEPGSVLQRMLWVWSPAVGTNWPSFESRTGMRGAVVGGLDFLTGIARAAGMHCTPVPGATGYIDTDYSAKATRAREYLDEYDFVLVHVNAADEEAHQRNPLGKRQAIESVDRLILEPLVAHLESRSREPFRVIVCGDHATQSSDGRHTDAPAPFLCYGPGIAPSGQTRFSERVCADQPPVPSLAFLTWCGAL
jgi:2,3-bisphosphoglycerate-independent phosphoglycerate mutase